MNTVPPADAVIPSSVLNLRQAERRERDALREKTLDWLEEGANLARVLYGDKATRPLMIWALLETSFAVMERVPDEERRWLTSGLRSGGWNMVGLSRQEADALEELRILCAMKPYDGTSKWMPQKNEVERAMGVLEWLRFIPTDGRHGPAFRRAAIQYLRSGDFEVIVRSLGLKRDKIRQRQVIYEIRQRVYNYTLRGLERTLGIVPSEQALGFRENI